VNGSSPLLSHIIPEVAKTLRTSNVNIYKLIRSGELIAVKFGSRVVVTDEDLRAFIEKHRTVTVG
jgi:excisionase family DNA binding protein